MRLGKVRYGNVIVVVVRAGGWPSLPGSLTAATNRSTDVRGDDDDDDVDTDIDIDIDIFWGETNGNYLDL